MWVEFHIIFLKISIRCTLRNDTLHRVIWYIGLKEYSTASRSECSTFKKFLFGCQERLFECSSVVQYTR